MTNEEIASAIRCPFANVDLYWPRILPCLSALGVASRNSQLGALATIAVETAHTFKPLHEYGTDALHEKIYGHRADLGDVHDGDGARYAGRGFIQITGEVNYAAYGKLLGVDLVDDPDRALEPDLASSIFAAFWHDRKIAPLCDADEWSLVRQRVNGGTNNLSDFLACVLALNAQP